MKTTVHYSKPDFTINEETGEVEVDIAYYIDLKDLLSKSFLEYLLNEHKFVKFMDKYEFDVKNLYVFFGTTGLAKCWMKYDKFDASLGMKIADTRAQMKAHYNVTKFIENMNNVIIDIIGMDKLMNIWNNNIDISMKSIKHMNNLTNN